MASQLLQGISQDEHERARFRSRRMFQNDMEAMRFTAFSEGERIGEARRDERRAKEIALSLKQSGMDVMDIAKHTGLTVEQIKELP